MFKKAQLSLINMIWWVMLVAVGAIVTPILAEFAGVASTTANSTLGTIIASAIVPMFWLGVIITFLLYIIPQGFSGQ